MTAEQTVGGEETVHPIACDCTPEEFADGVRIHGDNCAAVIADTEPPAARNWHDLVQAAAKALPDCPPFRGAADSLRAMLVDIGPVVDRAHRDLVVDELGATLHWLSGSLETLDAYGHVGELGAVEKAYDLLEEALELAAFDRGATR